MGAWNGQRRRWRTALVAAGLAAAPAFPAGPAGAGAAPATAHTDYALTYEIYAGGVHGLTVVFDVALSAPTQDDDAGYAARVRAHTEGIFRWIAPWHMDSASRGRRVGTRIEADRHLTASRWRARERRIEIVFRRDGAAEVTAEPPYDDDPDRRVAPAQLVGAIDPTSALARLVLAGATGCPAHTAVYDGRRRYDMLTAPLTATAFRASRYNPFGGTATGCHVTFAKVAGFRKDPDRKSIADYALSLWLGEAVAGEPALPVRLEADTPFGRLLGHLVRIARPDGTVVFGTQE